MNSSYDLQISGIPFTQKSECPMKRTVIMTRITFYVLSFGLCRLCLAYGGSDVTRTLFWLLQRAGFPYRDCQLSSRLDCQLLQHLKETFCHLDQVCVGHGSV